MTSFAGWQMPLRYASETAEHLAVRRAAGLFDLSHMGEIAVAGPEAGAALDYALVGNLSALRPGRARAKSFAVRPPAEWVLRVSVTLFQLMVTSGWWPAVSAR